MKRLILLVTDPSTTVAEYSGAFRHWQHEWADGDSFALYAAGPGFLVYGEPFPRQLPGGSRPPAGEEFDDQVLLSGAHGMLAGLEGGRRLTTLWLAGTSRAREQTIRELESLGEVIDRETVARAAEGGGVVVAPATRRDDHEPDGHDDDSVDESWTLLGVEADDAPDPASEEVDSEDEDPEDEDPEDEGTEDGDAEDGSLDAYAIVFLIVFALVVLGAIAGVGYGLWWGAGKVVTAVQGVLAADEDRTVDTPAPTPDAEGPPRWGGQLPWETVFAVGVCTAGPDPAGGNRVVVLDCRDERAQFQTVAVFRFPTETDTCPVNSANELRIQEALVCRISIPD